MIRPEEAHIHIAGGVVKYPTLVRVVDVGAVAPGKKVRSTGSRLVAHLYEVAGNGCAGAEDRSIGTGECGEQFDGIAIIAEAQEVFVDGLRDI